MGSHGPGRKRTPNKSGVTPEEDALNLIARQAEAQLAAKRAARAEAREIRMKELERQQKEEDSEPYTCSSWNHDLVPNDEEQLSLGSRSSTQGSSRMSTLSSVTLASLGGSSSQRGSGSSSVTADAEASSQDIKEIYELKDELQDVEVKYMQNLKEMKASLLEMEEKFRKAMVSNALLDNEKSNLMYEVDTMKDSLMELEEVLAETRRELEEKSKDLEREKHAQSILQFQHNELKETLKQGEELQTEMRQLRLKQDGFVHEIADLQETIEWKNKKIGALEKQKEYADAIRTERDELKDEVIQLKDILKKHGIVLGPDLSIIGDAEDRVDTTDSTEKPQRRSILGIQELQQGKDANKGGHYQQPREFDHGLHTEVLDGIQNSFEKEQNVSGTDTLLLSSELNDEVEADMTRSQQENPICVTTSETMKVEGLCSADTKHGVVATHGENTLKAIGEDIQSEKGSFGSSEKTSSKSLQSQSTSGPGKKGKKKRRSKQKHKKVSDKEGDPETRDNHEKPTDSHQVWKEADSDNHHVLSEEDQIKKEIAIDINSEEKINLVHNPVDFQSSNANLEKIVEPIPDPASCMSNSDSLKSPVSECCINNPVHDLELQSNTVDMKSNVDDLQEFCASNTQPELLSKFDTVVSDHEQSVDHPVPETFIEEICEEIINQVTKRVMESETVSQNSYTDEMHISIDAEASIALNKDEMLLKDEGQKQDIPEQVIVLQETSLEDNKIEDDCRESLEGDDSHLETPSDVVSLCVPIETNTEVTELNQHIQESVECGQIEEHFAPLVKENSEPEGHPQDVNQEQINDLENGNSKAEKSDTEDIEKELKEEHSHTQVHETEDNGETHGDEFQMECNTQVLDEQISVSNVGQLDMQAFCSIPPESHHDLEEQKVEDLSGLKMENTNNSSNKNIKKVKGKGKEDCKMS